MDESLPNNVNLDDGHKLHVIRICDRNKLPPINIWKNFIEINKPDIKNMVLSYAYSSAHSHGGFYLQLQNSIEAFGGVRCDLHDETGMEEIRIENMNDYNDDETKFHELCKRYINCKSVTNPHVLFIMGETELFTPVAEIIRSEIQLDGTTHDPYQAACFVFVENGKKEKLPLMIINNFDGKTQEYLTKIFLFKHGTVQIDNVSFFSNKPTFVDTMSKHSDRSTYLNNILIKQVQFQMKNENREMVKRIKLSMFEDIKEYVKVLEVQQKEQPQKEFKTLLVNRIKDIISVHLILVKTFKANEYVEIRDMFGRYVNGNHNFNAMAKFLKNIETNYDGYGIDVDVDVSSLLDVNIKLIEIFKKLIDSFIELNFKLVSHNNNLSQMTDWLIREQKMKFRAFAEDLPHYIVECLATNSLPRM